jgi:hypothetical protein
VATKEQIAGRQKAVAALLSRPPTSRRPWFSSREAQRPVPNCSSFHLPVVRHYLREYGDFTENTDIGGEPICRKAWSPACSEVPESICWESWALA